MDRPCAVLAGVTDIFPYIDGLAITASVAVVAQLDITLVQFVQLDPMSAAVCVSGDVLGLSALTSLDVPSVLMLQGEINEPRLRKCLDATLGTVCVSGSSEITLVKPTGPYESGLTVRASLDVHSVRLRELGDLVDLTLGDVSEWTLHQFYYKEE